MTTIMSIPPIVASLNPSPGGTHARRPDFLPCIHLLLVASAGGYAVRPSATPVRSSVALSEYFKKNTDRKAVFNYVIPNVTIFEQSTMCVLCSTLVTDPRAYRVFSVTFSFTYFLF